MFWPPQRLQSYRARVVAALTAACLSLSVAGAATAASPPSVPPARLDVAVLSMVDSTFGDPEAPLYFQVAGQGFDPGEHVTLIASLVVPGPGGESSTPLLPVQVVANRYGHIAATLDGGGIPGVGDGFVIRASGDQHAASIVDLALTGASYTAPGGD